MHLRVIWIAAHNMTTTKDDWCDRYLPNSNLIAATCFFAPQSTGTGIPTYNLLRQPITMTIWRGMLDAIIIHLILSHAPACAGRERRDRGQFPRQEKEQYCDFSATEYISGRLWIAADNRGSLPRSSFTQYRLPQRVFHITKVPDWCFTAVSGFRYYYQDPVVPRTD